MRGGRQQRQRRQIEKIYGIILREHQAQTPILHRDSASYTGLFFPYRLSIEKGGASVGENDTLAAWHSTFNPHHVPNASLHMRTSGHRAAGALRTHTWMLATWSRPTRVYSAAHTLRKCSSSRLSATTGPARWGTGQTVSTCQRRIAKRTTESFIQVIQEPIRGASLAANKAISDSHTSQVVHKHHNRRGRRRRGWCKRSLLGRRVGVGRLEQKRREGSVSKNDRERIMEIALRQTDA